jgi:RsiW-degrading membrane proteinase PrsW (M82 family)
MTQRIGEPPASRVRRVLTLALPVLAVVAVLVVDAVQLQALHMQEVLHRPTPRMGWYDYLSVESMVFIALSTFCSNSIAAIPAILILRKLGRKAGASGRAIIASAWLAFLLVGILGGRVQPVVLEILGVANPDAADLPIRLFLVTPLTEELFKLVAVAVPLALGVRLGGTRAGIVLGAAAGLGMTVFETDLYVQMDAMRMVDIHPFDAVAIRFALLGLNLHAAAAALAGGALGAWVAAGHRLRRPLLPIAGLAAAVAVHAVWNAAVEDLFGRVLTGIVAVGERATALQLFAASTAVSAVLLAVPFAVLAIAWRRAGRRPAALVPAEPLAAVGPDAFMEAKSPSE